MSVHIEAKKGEIAETILLPGDPLRAKWIAETFLDNPVCFNRVRGMLGYTGTYNGKPVSVMGTGMGVPSISIYAHELITEYGVKNLIRVGSSGSYQKHIKIRDIVLAMAASSNSGVNELRFGGADYAPTADFGLFQKAVEIAKKKNIPLKAGNVFTSDEFYADDFESYKKWSKFGVLCVEMETAGLYTVAAKHNVNALTILTISDSLVTGERTTSKERETTFKEMVDIALELA
ncbi:MULTISPECIES: purine-nucleoside phosphorylase [Xanthomarina]|jgi:purine-nucleoside phosphorylase|uniref:Uridine phosphorylase n=1 Tax=Xanthomarina gelatinilytica TaxID=1137281 RepID=M7MHD7_9FLAO|nr:MULTISPECIES: purine-nucleoside phosphorylase [Xanthomarina]MCB0388235.1 purine-nucleoside phosphorylase [Winogradskyella sp.]EMQ94230.1 Purine nucleoside phosphorylase [Xanthomarina gelatinilytica]MAL24264.1 purine-nucleoside phosphorylase [Xanthomarina sp.]MBF62647.1 purine-nucleoside phosphorylase [Xanthomarina sp.]MDX1316147.1 purine-nucleoside phosphorylase [Xanthomarina gelatinilytica]|tara:strand:- start:2864 stop:3562 length:699 start_codon:yes stop_codon:yes gene_type:complete